MKRLWAIPPILIALLVVASVGSLFVSQTAQSDGIVAHLTQTLVPYLTKNTIVLLIGVGGLTLIIGVSLAWFVTTYDFWGRSFLSWALILPLAIPAYVIAFVFVGLFDFTGSLQTLLRGWFPDSALWFPPIRSTGGVILVMSLALYPYIYLITKNAFQTQGAKAMEMGRSLGHTPFRLFWKIALPMALPWILAGLTLVFMETLADFGTVSIFNYDTFTTAIYQAWIGFFSISAAAKFAIALMMFAFVFLMVEQTITYRRRYFALGQPSDTRQRLALPKIRRGLVSGFCWSVFLMAFVVPAVQLVMWSAAGLTLGSEARYFYFLLNSLILSGLAALIICGVALICVAAERFTPARRPARLIKSLSCISLLGYAIPGSVLAVGVFILLSRFHVLLAGSICVLLTGYLIRFYALSHRSVDSAMKRITPQIDCASRSLGVGGLKMLKSVHMPLLKGGIFTGAVLVFVDVMKEMPMTLMTRPFGWDTLAVRIYEMTSEGDWQRAALPAVVLLCAGILPLIFMMKKSEKL